MYFEDEIISIGQRLQVNNTILFSPPCRKAIDNKGQSYETIMESSSGFNNPNNIQYLSDLMGLGQTNYSNMVGLR